MANAEIELQQGPISTITLRDARGLNLLGVSTLRELNTILEKLAQNSEVQVVIVTGAGNKAFCAGANMRELVTLEDIPHYVDLGQECCQRLEHFPVPTIAAINGYALGAGFSLALACDLRVLAQGATIGQLAVRNGLVPPFGNIQRILQTAGPARGRELIFTGRLLESNEALEYQLVNQIHENALQGAQALAEMLLTSPRHTLQWTKQIINRSLEEGFAVGYALQEDGLIACLEHESSRQIMQGFLKRKKTSE